MYKTLEMTDNAIILEYSLSAKIWNYPPLSSVTQWRPGEQEKGRKMTNTNLYHEKATKTIKRTGIRK